MRLYRFLKAEFGLAALREKRLRIGRIEELNDDFELVGIASTDRTERTALRRTRAELSKNRGILCMSRRWSSPLMWAHYGDRHTGMVLGFDVMKKDYSKVDYLERRPRKKDFGIRRLDQLTPDQMKRIILMKAAGWSYEEEYRAFFALSDDELIDGTRHYFVPFSTRLRLREVIVGSRYKGARSEVVKTVDDATVNVFMARGSFEDFKVVRQRDEQQWR